MTQLSQGIHKAPTGIAGFDEVSLGGLPRNRTTLILGGPGSGKTIFALQTLVNGLRDFDEPGIFVAFEESSENLRANASSFRWDLPGMGGQERLYFLDALLDPEIVRSGDFDIAPLLATIQAQAADMGAKRVVFDGIDVLLALLDDADAERREVYRLHRWLQNSGMTGLVTAKAEGPEVIGARYSFLQFMADAVVIFSHRVVDNVSLRGVRVDKYRGSQHSANEFPLTITPNGIQVARYSGTEMNTDASRERVSSGIPQLDAMAGGGYYTGSCVLISGSPGTAKTTLAGAYVDGACERGERALFISFDEGAEAIVRNLASVGINLARHVESGLLRLYAIRTSAYSAEAHLIHIQDLIAEHQPTSLVVDPVSALSSSGGRLLAADATTRLIDVAKARGITTICTSLLSTAEPTGETTLSDISTIADVWIHLSYVIRAGERNRAITIIKSRGTKHSNQVRELLLADGAITIAEVSTVGGEVLMGTARWEQEAVAQAEEQRVAVQVEQRRRQLKLEQTELQARMATLEAEMEARRSDLALLNSEEAAREEHEKQKQDVLFRLRKAGED